MDYTDAELTSLYNEANNITIKNPPLTTQRIFAAMRFIAEDAVRRYQESESPKE